MTMQTIGFIGAGNITRALVAGMIGNGYDADKIWVSNPTPEKLTYFAETFSVYTTQSNLELARAVDVIVFAVKPNQVAVVCREIQETVVERASLIISVATGINTQTFQEELCNEAAVVRAMPNTPVIVAAGATGLFANANVTDAQLDMAESLFRDVGVVVWLEEESLIDVVTAVSGSAPAYFFLMMEAMQSTAEALGLKPLDAKLLVLQTALGSSRLALESEHTLQELRASVTAPNGTTEAAIKVMEAGNIRKLMADTIKAAVKRAHELAES